MTWLIEALRTKLGQAAALALSVLAALGLARRHWRSQGRDEAEQEARDDADERVERGRRAVHRGRGGDPAQRLRDNDGRWD